MSDVYTRYVLTVKTDGSSPAEELFDEVWEELRQDLKREMKKRTLWSSSPALLGLPGTDWDDGDAFDELLADCYAFTFVDRLQNLRAQMLHKKRDNVHGLVVRNLRNFLTDRQRRADPIGYRVFELLRRAVAEAVTGGELHLLAGDPRIRNDTVLGFDPQVRPDPPGRDFAETVTAWNDELLPELVTARSRRVTEVVARLRSLVLGLRDAGVDAFCFGDLIDPMKRDVRERWNAAWSGTVEVASESGDGEGPAATVVVVPAFDPAGIYRERLPHLFQILQRIVAACRSGRQPVELAPAASAGDPPTPRSLADRERRKAS